MQVGPCLLHHRRYLWLVAQRAEGVDRLDHPDQVDIGAETLGQPGRHWYCFFALESAVDRNHDTHRLSSLRFCQNLLDLFSELFRGTHSLCLLRVLVAASLFPPPPLISTVRIPRGPKAVSYEIVPIPTNRMCLAASFGA